MEAERTMARERSFMVFLGSGFDDQNIKGRVDGHGCAVLVEDVPATGGKTFVVDADGMIDIHTEGAAGVPVRGNDKDGIGIAIAERVFNFGGIAKDSSGGGAVDKNGRGGPEARA